MHLALPSLILIGAVITDLRTKKVFNWYIVVAAVCALANTVYFFGYDGIIGGLLGAGLAAAMAIPLWLAKVLGGGDVKLLMVLGLCTSYGTVFNVILGSFIFAAVIGIVYAIFNGTFKILTLNTLAVLKGEKPERITFHKLPFTVAILMAWVTYHTTERMGGPLW
jgi:prepilin peptidase CpaA